MRKMRAFINQFCRSSLIIREINLFILPILPNLTIVGKLCQLKSSFICNVLLTQGLGGIVGIITVLWGVLRIEGGE